MLITKEVEIKISNRNIERLKEKGYDCRLGEKIKIVPNDLENFSSVQIQYKCDNPNCGKIVTLRWEDYVKKRKRDKYGIGDFCSNCSKKIKTEWMKQNKRQEFDAEMKRKYEKAKKTIMEKYGVENPMQLEKVKEKFKENFIKKYGVDNPAKLPEIRKKMAETLQTNNEIVEILSPNGKKYYRYKGISCSKNQKYLCDLYGGELNYWVDYFYTVDILLKNKIYFEYNGPGHNLSVCLGKETEESQFKKECKRYYTLKEKGYKGIFLNSLTKRKLPPDNILLQIKEIAVDFLSHNGNNWIVFDIDKNLIRTKNIEIFYDFKKEIDFSLINKLYEK